ncbi:uncharacterized protein TNCV_1273721 [Trichonephila clavipes]|nr:uncharacterized protein TNCV_1273721 [Trichonephila clavipes]
MSYEAQLQRPFLYHSLAVGEAVLSDSKLVLAENGRDINDFRLTLYKWSNDSHLRVEQQLLYLTRVYDPKTFKMQLRMSLSPTELHYDERCAIKALVGCIRRVLTAVGMTSYTNQEMAGIHIICSIADGNALKARRLYGERFPSRRLPNRKTFECLHQRLRETGSFVRGMQDTGRTKSAITPELEEHVLREFEQPETRTRTVSAAVNVSHMTVWRLLGAEGL